MLHFPGLKTREAFYNSLNTDSMQLLLNMINNITQDYIKLAQGNSEHSSSQRLHNIHLCIFLRKISKN